jgi:signal transduction histidine kinase
LQEDARHWTIWASLRAVFIRQCSATSDLLAAVEARLARLPLAVRIEPDGIGPSTRYAAQTGGAAYFVGCEARTNAVKHAAATGVTVCLAQTDGHLRVEVADDGCGFDSRAVTASGLRGLTDRVEAPGGEFSVHSQPRAGTRLCPAAHPLVGCA